MCPSDPPAFVSTTNNIFRISQAGGSIRDIYHERAWLHSNMDQVKRGEGKRSRPRKHPRKMRHSKAWPPPAFFGSTFAPFCCPRRCSLEVPNSSTVAVLFFVVDNLLHLCAECPWTRLALSATLPPVCATNATGANQGGGGDVRRGAQGGLAQGARSKGDLRHVCLNCFAPPRCRLHLCV